MEKIIIKFNGDAKVGIFRKSQKVIEFDTRSGIHVLIERVKLPALEKGKVYSVESPKFRILEKCVILDGKFNMVTKAQCEEGRSYVESIYTTHPVRVVKVEYFIFLTNKVRLNSLDRVEEVFHGDDRFTRMVIHEEVEYEKNPLPAEYEWMLKKARGGKGVFERGGSLFLSEDENLEILDAKIVTPRWGSFEYEIKTNLPICEVTFREYNEEYEGEKIYRLYVPKDDSNNIYHPEKGVVKIVTCHQGEQGISIEESLPTDQDRYVDDGEMQLTGMGRMLYQNRSSANIGRREFGSYKPVRPLIDRKGNVGVVEFWGRRYAVVYDSCSKGIDRLETDDQKLIDQWLLERSERISEETFQLEKEKFLCGITNNFEVQRELLSWQERDFFNIPFSTKTENKGQDNRVTEVYTEYQCFVAELVKFLDGAVSVANSDMLDKAKVKITEFKNEKVQVYELCKKMIVETRILLSEKLKQSIVSCITNETREINADIRNLEDIARDGNIDVLKREIEQVNERINLLPELSFRQDGINSGKQIKDRQDLLLKAGQLGIPETLLDIFSGDTDRAGQFMSNVEKLETFRIDSHEITCGRSRARQTCDYAWEAMGENSDFFCGADPNDVKHYVYEYHFRSGENQETEGDFYDEPRVSEISESSNDAIYIVSNEDKPILPDDLQRLMEKFGK